MIDWRKFTPLYDPGLSSGHLLTRGELFQIGDSPLPVNDYRVPHWHDTYEIGYVRDGCGIIVMGQEEYSFEPGQVYIINDLKPHMGYTTGPPATLFVVHFHPTILDDGWVGRMGQKAHVPFLPHFGLSSPLIPMDDPITPQVREVLDSIREEALARETAWEIIIGGLILKSVGLLARWLLKDTRMITEDHQQREALKRINPILHLIDVQFRDPISLADMAQVGHVSRSYCCELFQCALNTSPIAYRNTRRIAEARRLLKHSDLTVNEIALQVGFGTVQEFNRLFRRECDLTPSQFRAQFTEF
jgi:AraC-like DNA-binding protein